MAFDKRGANLVLVPLGSRFGIGFSGKATHRLATTLAGQPLDDGDDGSGVRDEKLCGPSD